MSSSLKGHSATKLILFFNPMIPGTLRLYRGVNGLTRPSIKLLNKKRKKGCNVVFFCQMEVENRVAKIITFVEGFEVPKNLIIFTI